MKEWIAGSGLWTILIEAGATWQNASIESLNGRFRDEFLNGELFGSLVEAQGLGEDDPASTSARAPLSTGLSNPSRIGGSPNEPIGWGLRASKSRANPDFFWISGDLKRDLTWGSTLLASFSLRDGREA